MLRRALVGASLMLTVLVVSSVGSFPVGPEFVPVAQVRTNQSGLDERCSTVVSAPRIGSSPGATIGALSDADLDHELNLARDAGMFSIRVDIDWSTIESVRGRFDWTRADRVLTAIVQHGMCPLGIIAYTPQWARTPAAYFDPHSRPANPDTFAAFAATVVRRYGAYMNTWEIWNEPNIATFYKPRPDVAAYGALLRASYTAIKQLQPDSTILCGGMAPAVSNGTDIAPDAFLSQMYALGSNKYFDAFNVHPYTYPSLPNDPSTASWNTAMKMWPMHDTMVRGGDGAKQIWITEFGAPTGTASRSVSEQTQSDSIGIIMDAVLGTSWIGPAFVYSLRDAGTNLADTEQNFGILRRDFTPKLAYGRVDAFTAAHSVP